MELGELKPILTALALPPVSPLLLALFGVVLSGRRWLAGAVMAFIGLALMWFLSCNAVAVGLAETLLPQVAPLNVQKLAASGAQAVVVLGGGVHPQAPEWGRPQLTSATFRRLRYGAWLARQADKPLGFAGGIGWAAGAGAPTEGSVAQRTAQAEWGIAMRWVDDQSRDTQQGAVEMWRLLQRDRINRIVLVTDAWHMPRSVLQFQKAGFEVIPGPTGFILARGRPLLEWLPSTEGLMSSRVVLREWLGLRVAGV